MKKIFLLSFTALLFTNTLFLADNSISAQSFSEQIKMVGTVKEISPTGIWFTEDDQLP